MKYKGQAYKFGKDINTDEIIPARYLDTSDPIELAKHCMEDADPQFAKNVKEGDVIVADDNFGCGSSREHAPISIKAAGVSCIIAPSFARIFFRNAINIGLPIIVSKEASQNIKTGNMIEVDTLKGELQDVTNKKKYKIAPYPEFLQKMIESNGLMNIISKQIKHTKPKNTNEKTIKNVKKNKTKKKK